MTHPATPATDWQVNERDRELWDRELASFVPPRVFDSHVHLYDVSQFQGSPPPLCAKGPPSAGWGEFQRQIGELMPGRKIQATCFAFPALSVDFDAANAFLAQQCRRDGCRGQMLIEPSMDAEFIRQSVQDCGFVGLKPYHLFASDKPTFDAHIPSYLPESHVRVAHELGLSITLHIVRSRALADASNQEVLRHYATTYPSARLILAHAARGFNPHHTIEGIHALRGLGNVWFDTSVVTDAGAIEAIVRVMGHEQVLYGSDFPVSHLRGRCVALGDSFLWLTQENTKLDASYADVQFALVGHEALRTLKVAALGLGLSDSQVEDIFLHSAEALWQ
ncbi:MAG TPA: amidohydrolase family protein [Pirellulaceae bacterium]|nr:amidohydrolase family protein [Pirellulaceae bacterium]